MNTQSGKSHQKNYIKASDIVEELKQGSKALLPLEPNTVIDGDLDLSNLVVDRPVKFKTCYFKGNVDLRYCEFKQVVNFSGCTFHKKFNSGDATGSLTIYRKDLICKECCFEDVAYFNRIHVEGDADFTDSRFELESPEKWHDSLLTSGYTVDFADAQ
jgi:hypothetical protein